MKEKTRITSVVAHIDHGKTSLIDSLVASQGRISKTLAGSLRFLDTREDEQTRGITLKLSAIALEHRGSRHIFIDTPGHVDFESLIQTSSVFSDSFLVLIDINEGITPRTYSLVSYIRRKRCVLAINKIDKVVSESELLQKTFAVISSINALVGEDMFAWEENNVILCCATLCYGINSRQFLRILGKGGSLKNAVSFLFHLYNRIDRNEIENICTSFNIRTKNKKSILSTVLPLAECIFDSVGDDAPEGSLALLASDLVVLRPMETAAAPSLVAVTAYGMLRMPGVYSRDNVLFVTKILQGRVCKGDVVYSVDCKSIAECVVESIYLFGINELVEVDAVEGHSLVCLGGNFLRNSLITDVPTHWIDIESKITPFYQSKLVLNSAEQLDELRSVFRAMSCTEQFLKVRLNRYGEMEVLCTGRVQFEKILADLTKMGFRYQVADFEAQFCEYATTPHSAMFSLNNLRAGIEVSRSEDECTAACAREWRDQNKNHFVLVSDTCSDIVEGVLEVFVSSGPLIRERVHETRFVVDVQGTVDASSDALYAFFRNSLAAAYTGSSPSIAPLFYECLISVQEELIGDIYKCLSKCNYIARGEDYEDRTGFCIIDVLIPQFLYTDFLEDVRVRTRGTAYLTLREAGYICVLDFSRQIAEIRKRKGLFVEEKIVEEASRQRTNKK